MKTRVLASALGLLLMGLMVQSLWSTESAQPFPTVDSCSRDKGGKT